MKNVYILSDSISIKEKVINYIDGEFLKLSGVSNSVSEGLLEIIAKNPDLIFVSFKKHHSMLRMLSGRKVFHVGDVKILDGKQILENEIPYYLKLEKEKERKKRAYIIKEKLDLVIIGISTGGPATLKKLIPKIRQDISLPIIINQHMPPGFTFEMAKSLNYISKIKVKEAKDNEKIEKGNIYIVPGAYNATIKEKNATYYFDMHSEKNGVYTPSLDFLLKSIIGTENLNPLVVVMTGMGNDGFEGIVTLRKHKRGFILTQNEEECIVYGMPKYIDERKLYDIKGLEISEIAEQINKKG